MILDPVGASYLAENLASLKQDGRLVNIGIMGGGKAELNLGLVLMKRLSIIGSTLRSQPLAVKAPLAQALAGTILPAIAAAKSVQRWIAAIPGSRWLMRTLTWNPMPIWARWC
jgi:NADPH2:quinone reductase